MKVENIISGKYPFKLPELPDLVLVVPKAGVITRLQPQAIKILHQYEETNGGFGDYTLLDAETDLLKKYPDFYEVQEKADAKKREILLTLTEEETPDERFLKTPDEIQEMSDEEIATYLDYYRKQYGKLQQKYAQEPIIRKAIEYQNYKDELVRMTKDFQISRIKRIIWLVLTAEKTDGSKYFDNPYEGVKTILDLDFNSFSILMEMWDGIIEGFNLPF